TERRKSLRLALSDRLLLGHRLGGVERFATAVDRYLQCWPKVPQRVMAPIEVRHKPSAGAAQCCRGACVGGVRRVQNANTRRYQWRGEHSRERDADEHNFDDKQ